ncbi:MAG TPA: NAD(P)-dependent oxidoreductase, partial [Acidimicrobiia bacterium]
MGRVVVTRRLPEGGTDPLVTAGHEVVLNDEDVAFTKLQLCGAARDADALLGALTDRIDDDVLAAGGTRLRVVATVAVGYDNIDVSAAAARGIAVCNTPGVLDDTTADLAFLLILAAARLASDAERDLRAGSWPGWGITQYLGVDVHGAILGVVGFGRIGQAVARRGAGFGMEVLHHTRSPTGMP